jgi:hypothetical protein
MSDSISAPISDPAEAAAIRVLERLPALANADAWLVRRGRYLSTDWLLQAGAAPFHVKIAEGRVAALERGPRLMTSWSFAIRVSARGWLRFWQPVPEPGWHDLFAMTRHREATVEGYLAPLLTHLQYFKDLLALPRREPAPQLVRAAAP